MCSPKTETNESRGDSNVNFRGNNRCLKENMSTVSTIIIALTIGLSSMDNRRSLLDNNRCQKHGSTSIFVLSVTCYWCKILNEPRCEETGLRGFRPGPTQTWLYSHRRWLEA